MSELTILQEGKRKTIYFEGEVSVSHLLKEAGVIISHPCGGHGKCGKCQIDVSGDVLPPNEIEKIAGVRLSCQARVFGDATVTLPDNTQSAQIETESQAFANTFPSSLKGCGAAVDIGTTTIVVKTFDLSNGKELGTLATINPQTSISADIMGRIEASINGELELLNRLVTDKIKELIARASPDKKTLNTLVITGNTTMLYLLCKLDPSNLAKAPFIADNLFGNTVKLFGANCYLPPCMNAFVGADITCAVLASDMCKSDDAVLLCDIGTNGEIALWKNHKLYVTSTAAGPAFEGVGISCGCGSILGAIDRVAVENKALQFHTIGEEKAIGICGSGLIDAVAAGLQLGIIDESGAMDNNFFLNESISLCPKDIRSVQLAKAAIIAGINTLLQVSKTNINEIKTFYIAGGFGSHLNIKNACKIGLIPSRLADRAFVLGNAAISGAARVLLNKHEKNQFSRIVSLSEHINLGGNSVFNENFIEGMFFEEF